MSDIIDFLNGQSVSDFFDEQRQRITRHLSTRYGVSDDDAEEAFSEGCLALFEAIEAGRFTEEEREFSLGKYLQTCCRNQLLKMLEHRQREVATDFQANEAYSADAFDDEADAAPTAAAYQPAFEAFDTVSEAEQRESDFRQMDSILSDLPYPCKDLILGKYGEKFSAAEMAQRLGYSNSRVAITTLSRCMQKLKKHFNSERRLLHE